MSKVTSSKSAVGSSTIADALPKNATVCRQFVRCGKAGCRCRCGSPHGPYWYLFWREDGRLRKRYVPKIDVAAALAACVTGRDAGRRWRSDLAAARRRWADLSATVKGATHG